VLKAFRDTNLLAKELAFTVSAPVQLIRTFMPLLLKGKQKVILVLSSILGSIERAPSMPNLSNAYSISRAALNMSVNSSYNKHPPRQQIELTSSRTIRKWSATAKNDGVTMALIHPGKPLRFQRTV
jgi:NAD(P)-dependent dehydrogenase (short-subunit alcohol dehydrogenase family)